MPASMSNPRDLLLVVLGELLFVERTLVREALPGLIDEVEHEALSSVLAEHLGETRDHVVRVEDSFRSVGAESSSNHSLALCGLIEQHSQLAQSALASSIKDALALQAAIHTEHYEIAAYRGLLPLAGEVAPDAVPLIEANLSEEETALQKLEGLARDVLAALPPAGVGRG
jgi:ferritin-like metal-binding protein YciE